MRQVAQSLHKNLPSFTTIRATSRTQDLQDLLPPPTKALDLWRFEGEATDLHPHRSVFHFILICLRDLMLVFLFGSLVDLLLMCCCWLLYCYRFGSLQFSCGCVPQELCKGPVSASRKYLSGSGLGLRGVAHRRSEWSLRGCWFGFRSNHTPPNVDVPSCKGRELRESSPCHRVLHSRLPLSYSISYIA